MNPKCVYCQRLPFQTPPESFAGEREFKMVTTIAGDKVAKQFYMGRQNGSKQSVFHLSLENAACCHSEHKKKQKATFRIPSHILFFFNKSKVFSPFY